MICARTSLILWCKIESFPRSEFEGNAEIHCFGPRGDHLTAHIIEITMQNWILFAARARRRHRNFKALAVEVIVWSRTSFKLWCKRGSCARSEFEDNVETNALALEVIAAPRTSLKLWCKMGSCARSEFDGSAEIHYSRPGGFHGGFMPALHNFVWFPMGLHWFGPRADGLVAHIFDIIMMQNLIMSAARIWRTWPHTSGK